MASLVIKPALLGLLFALLRHLIALLLHFIYVLQKTLPDPLQGGTVPENGLHNTMAVPLSDYMD